MEKTIVFISIFLGLIVLCLFQSSKEDLTIDYRWGLHDKKPKHEIEENQPHKRHRHKRHQNRPEFRKDHSWFDNLFEKKVNTGAYKCYYEPDEDNQCAEIMGQCPIQNHPDMSNYILKSKIPPQPDMSNYILKSEIPSQPDMSAYIHKDEIPKEKDMSNYINKNDLHKYIKDCPTCDECPTCPIPIESDNNKNVDLSKYMLKSECNKKEKTGIDFGDILPAFMKEKSKCVAGDDNRRNSFQKKC
tara:strand:- start:410 stop:1141 length:732 start_codon:yes stop_codon:yes gene_type:complete